MTRKRFIDLLTLSGPFLVAHRAFGQAQAKPEIRITTVPPAEDGDAVKTYLIEGTARGVDFRTHRVVVWSYAGGQWWVQPTAAAPKTPIDPEGNWGCDAHPGFQYAAALVTANFTPRSVVPKEPEVGGDVLAVDIVARRRAGKKK